MWALAVWLVIALLYGFCWGWDYGLRKGRAEHAQCHHAREAIVEQARQVFLASVIEHADIEAWEEEL